MKKFKKGDIVARKSYEKDIIFYIKKIIKNSNSEVAILCGLFERIEADSNVDDLILLDHNFVKKMFSTEEKRLSSRIDSKNNDYRFNSFEAVSYTHLTLPTT